MKTYAVRWATVCYWESEIEANDEAEARRLVEQGAAEGNEDEERRIGEYNDRADLGDEYEHGNVEIEEALPRPTPPDQKAGGG